MNWNAHITALVLGETIVFRPRGNSMEPRVRSGQKCTVEPAKVADVAVGDVVLCKVHGTAYLHLVTAKDDARVQISNNHGHVNGWTSRVYGKTVKVED